MHIAFLSPEYPNPKKPEGGLGNYTRKVSLELIQRGHLVTIFILARNENFEVDQGIQLCFISRMKFHWRFHRIKKLHPWLELGEQWISARRLKKAVFAVNKHNHIDILQTPNFRIPGMFLSHNRFFPLVCRCSSIQTMLRSANGSRRSLPEAIADWLEARQVTEADAAFSPSELIAKTYERFEAFKPIIIRTPIDFSHMNLDPSIYLKTLQGKSYLLYFGTLNGVKGVDLLIKAIPGVLATYKDLRFILIGRDDILPGGIKAVDLLRTNLKEYIDEKRVIYLPSLPKLQLYPIIEHALCVVMPSRVDNYPNACLEAMSLGVPVVGTFESSIDEIITNGETGFLSKNNDPVSLQQSIVQLLELTPEQRRAMINRIHLEIEEIRKEDRVGILLQFYKIIIAAYARN